MFGFGRKNVAPAEVAAGLLGIVAPVRDEGLKEVETLQTLGPVDVNRIQEELFFVRAFAVLHSVRRMDAKVSVREAFWLFLAEQAQLSPKDMSNIKRGLGDYDDLAFMDLPDGALMLQEVGKLFANHIGQRSHPIVALVGAHHFGGAYKLASDFCRVGASRREGGGSSRRSRASAKTTAAVG